MTTALPPATHAHHEPHPAVNRDRILALTVRYLSMLRARYGLQPAEAFVYGWSDALQGADYRRCEFFPYRPEEPYTAYFEAIRCLTTIDKFGGWSLGLVQVRRDGAPRIRGARVFVGYEDGELRLQFYNVPDSAVLSEVRWHLRGAFAGQGVTVQVFE